MAVLGCSDQRLLLVADYSPTTARQAPAQDAPLVLQQRCKLAQALSESGWMQTQRLMAEDEATRRPRTGRRGGPAQISP